ncbi:MAG: glycosyltransferase, partial [Clostridia bacterium]|nr:glycosyltransferase [Clostridia bacterium]
MKSVQINLTAGLGSTGRICCSIREALLSNGWQADIFCAQAHPQIAEGAVSYMSKIEGKKNAFLSRLFGCYGFTAKRETRRLIRLLEHARPDVIHLHNLHGHNCDLARLFRYIRQKNLRVIWTFHDCWAFTGYCPHYDMIGCEQWKTECKKCPQRRRYSWFFDRSNELFHKKRDLLSDLDLTIVTPSSWLAKQVGESFLSHHPLRVIPNGIDTELFRPCESDLREKFGLADRFVLLGVSYDWSDKKGLDVFLELAKILGKEYRIVLVGVDEKTRRHLPSNILALPRTHSKEELAQIYSASDLFVNPTREENYPTVNMEALSCGTPVLTFNTFL